VDLTQLANLGEFIGGVTVLLALVYLAVQLRASNVRARVNACQRGATHRPPAQRTHRPPAIPAWGWDQRYSAA